MIWGLFSKPDYEHSKARMWVLVKSAIDKFYRAQSYVEIDPEEYEILPPELRPAE
tara:strand:+ start:12976 stop:13140 length:165 start_codon:yes stop_codon:yes gene_type:complete